jgi:hypothetical protein
MAKKTDKEHAPFLKDGENTVSNAQKVQCK